MFCRKCGRVMINLKKRSPWVNRALCPSEGCRQYISITSGDMGSPNTVSESTLSKEDYKELLKTEGVEDGVETLSDTNSNKNWTVERYYQYMCGSIQEKIESGDYVDKPTQLFSSDGSFNPDNWNGGDIVRDYIFDIIDGYKSEDIRIKIHYDHNGWVATVNDGINRRSYALEWYKRSGRTHAITCNWLSITIKQYVDLINYLGIPVNTNVKFESKSIARRVTIQKARDVVVSNGGCKLSEGIDYSKATCHFCGSAILSTGQCPKFDCPTNNPELRVDEDEVVAVKLVNAYGLDKGKTLPSVDEELIRATNGERVLELMKEIVEKSYNTPEKVVTLSSLSDSNFVIDAKGNKYDIKVNKGIYLILPDRDGGNFQLDMEQYYNEDLSIKGKNLESSYVPFITKVYKKSLIDNIPDKLVWKRR